MHTVWVALGLEGCSRAAWCCYGIGYLLEGCQAGLLLGCLLGAFHNRQWV
jgi:hypothetical protein